MWVELSGAVCGQEFCALHHLYFVGLLYFKFNGCKLPYNAQWGYSTPVLEYDIPLSVYAGFLQSQCCTAYSHSKQATVTELRTGEV